MTPKEFNITEYSKAFISKIKHYENKNVLFIGFDDIDVISEIINQKYKNCNIYIVDNKETCDCIPLLDLKANIYVLNSYNEENNYIKEVFGPLNFYDDILISIWKNGASISTSALKLLKENGICICSMLLSNYKKNELYRHVETFELANPKLFKDAVITENLCICSLKKKEINKYDYTSMRELTFSKIMAEYYKWNIIHNKNLFMARRDYKSYSLFDKSLDFVDTSRCMDSIAHGYFSKGTSFGYLWNTGKDGYQKNWGAKLGVIHFETKQAKENFQKFAYNWTENKYDCLASKALRSLKAAEASSEYYFAIPQIDWSNINISQKELWDKGLYDEAVLSEMHLKWNDDKTEIIQA